MSKRRIILVNCLVVGAMAIAGCGKNGESGDDEEVQTFLALPTIVEEYPKLICEWECSNGQEESNSVGPILGSPRSLKFIDDFFLGMDWSAPETQPSISIKRSEVENLEIRLSSDTVVDNPVFVAVWTRPGPAVAEATSATVRRSQKFSGSEQAIELLRAFVTRKGDVQAAAEWADR